MTNWDGLNRRKFPRANYPCMIIIRNHHVDSEAILTHTENIGIGGVGVVLKKAIKLFASVEVEIDLLDTETHIKCEGKVVWSVQRRSSDDKKPFFYDTGIEFSNIANRDEQRIVEVVNRLIRIDRRAAEE